MSFNSEKKIILFDGVCNLCNSTVKRVIKNDKKDIFRFTALQSAVGMVMVSELGIDTAKIDSIILIEGDSYSVKSTAALRIAKELSSAYPILYGFIIIPAVIRNWVYDFIAKNRYKWYGRQDSCMIPTPELKKKFL